MGLPPIDGMGRMKRHPPEEYGKRWGYYCKVRSSTAKWGAMGPVGHIGPWGRWGP